MYPASPEEVNIRRTQAYPAAGGNDWQVKTQLPLTNRWNVAGAMIASTANPPLPHIKSSKNAPKDLRTTEFSFFHMEHHLKNDAVAGAGFDFKLNAPATATPFRSTNFVNYQLTIGEIQSFCFDTAPTNAYNGAPAIVGTNTRFQQNVAGKLSSENPLGVADWVRDVTLGSFLPRRATSMGMLLKIEYLEMRLWASTCSLLLESRPPSARSIWPLTSELHTTSNYPCRGVI